MWNGACKRRQRKLKYGKIWGKADNPDGARHKHAEQCVSDRAQDKLRLTRSPLQTDSYALNRGSKLPAFLSPRDQGPCYTGPQAKVITLSFSRLLFASHMVDIKQ